MQLDTVHDIQSAYRRLVTAMSYPGTVVDLSAEAAAVDLASSLPKPLLLIAMMLLDAEVTFSLCAPDADRESRTISQLTYARVAAEAEAAFLLVDAGGSSLPPLSDDAVGQAIEAARVGTLESPHLGATIVLGVESLRDPAVGGPQKGVRLTLAGPGIQNQRALGVAGPTGWVEQRREKNREYPLGIDLILYTPEGYVAGLPRTIQIVEAVAWDT